MKKLRLVLLWNVVLLSCNAQKQAAVVTDTKPIAFPGAEGFGKYSTGGRGGRVIYCFQS